MNLLSLPAFDDNYIWMIHNGREAVVVDPGDATPVIAALDRADLQLAGILVTHKHPDHVGGLRTLLAHPRANAAQVWGPGNEPMPVPVIPVNDGGRIALPSLGLDIEVMAVPGHTLGHLAFFTGSILFCGDTLFSGGCGRLFEGTPVQMSASLGRLPHCPQRRGSVAPTNTPWPICVSRAQSSRTASPWRRTRPSASPCVTAVSLPCHRRSGQERQINPYLRCDQPDVIACAVARGAEGRDPVSVLATIRLWKDQFR